MATDQASRIRVLVVDGDAMVRQALTRQLAENTTIEVVGTAINARTALPKTDSYRPDVISVDLVSTDVDGLAFVQSLRQKDRSTGLVLMVADTDAADSLRARVDLAPIELLVRAESAPGGGTGRQFAAAVLQAAVATQQTRGTTKKAPEAARPSSPAATGIVSGRTPGVAQVVGIGTSTGGPNALGCMLPMLPADFPLPILIVQHMPPDFTASLAQSLARSCKLPVREARGGEILVSGEVLIAPGGKHLRVVRTDQGIVTRVTEDPPENSCRPAVDYLFRSLREVYGAATIAVMMTGMGEDGFLGCQQLRAAGAWLIAQDAASCTVYGMPRGPIETGIVDVVAPLEGIAARICEAANGRVRCN
jgi:two-component system chemotaxis response regulator CheB